MEVSPKVQGEDRTVSLTLLEKLALGVFSTATFSMLGWVVVTTNETASTVRVLESAITFIQRDAEKATQDRFTGSQGREMERRVEDLEQYHKGGGR
jgi:hypothetical protein